MDSLLILRSWTATLLGLEPKTFQDNLKGLAKEIGPPWRKKQTPANGTLKPDFERLADLPFQRLIGGHGGLLESNGPALLRASIERELG